MTTITRSEWGARSPNPGPGQLSPSRVEGIAFHWPGMARPLNGIEEISAALRDWQRAHIDDRRWADIAYQVAVDQAGNRYILRGLAIQSAANGDEDVNARFGAALLILGPGEEPSASMVAAARRVVADHRRLFPHSTRIVGHGQIRPSGTACPGPDAQEAINDGVFEPTPTRRPNRVERAHRRLRQAQRLLDDTPRNREVVHVQAERLRELREALPAQ